MNSSRLRNKTWSRSGHNDQTTTRRRKRGQRVRMKILVLGGDGYLGWPTALHLSARGHEVTIVDNLVRREYDREMGVDSLVPIASLQDRVTRWEQVSGHAVNVRVGNLTDAAFTYGVVAEARPDAIVHFGEQRSAPYSMIDREHAVYTQVNNVVGTLNLMYAIEEIDPDIHLVKLGTMGEYGTPTSTSKRASSRSPTRAAPTCCPTPSSRAPSTTCPRCTTATTSCSPAASGASGPPISTRASSTASRPRRPTSTRCWRPASTTTVSSAPC